MVAASALTVLPTPVSAQVDPGRPGAAQAGSQQSGQPGRTRSVASRAPEEVNDDPLTITIDTLSPSVVPESGNVTITGMVTNTTEETWSDVNLYPLVSTSPPMTSVEELDAAAQADDDLVVGTRRTEVSGRITTLAPGEVAPYTLRFPRSFLGRTEGVHWLGVHALGTNTAGRDSLADGKARTFLPLVADARPAAEAALVLQLRRRIDYTVDGRLDQTARWAEDLALEGRLRDVVELGASAGDRPITWLLDPAVIASVNALVGGNASRMPPPPESEEPTTEESPAPAPTDAGIGSDATDPTAVAAAATEGQGWLDRLQQALDGQELLALPYGDVDASAASRLQSDLLTEARTTSATVMAALGLEGSPAIGSPNGWLNPTAIDDADPGTTLLLTDEAVDVPSPPVVSLGGHDVVLTSSTAIQGGPGPDDPLATVAMRQRVLSEAAVRLLSPGREPLVVAFPNDWAPTDLPGFFNGLDVDWLDLRHVSDLTDDPAVPVDLAEIVYPPFQQDFELDADNFTAADGLTSAGETMEQVLTSNSTVGDAVTREAFTETAYWQRLRPIEARAAADRSRAWIETTLGRVSVDGPPSVTLSSNTGQFPATVRNGLDEPVEVRVVAIPSRGLSLESPDPVQLDPGESARLRLSATTEQIGAHSVRLVVASVGGDPLGSSVELPIRSNQVSEIIWIVIVAGGGLLFGAIAVRLFRRIRRTRAASGAEAATDVA